MKVNHMICPHCGHDFYTDAAYATCDACQCMFYASESKTSDKSRQGMKNTWPFSLLQSAETAKNL